MQSTQRRAKSMSHSDLSDQCVKYSFAGLRIIKFVQDKQTSYNITSVAELKELIVEGKNEISINSGNKLRRIIRYSVAIAASIFLIIIFIEGCKFYKLSPQKLYAETYSPYELSTSVGQVDSTVSKIELAYREKKYGAVINLNKTSVLSVKDVFLTGMSFLETNDYSRAISNFQVVIADAKDDKAFSLKNASEYYLALAYLRNNDYDQAIELMNAIHDSSSHQYKDKFTRKYINRVKRLKWR